MAAIDPTPEYVAQLLSMAHSPSELRAKGFALAPLSAAELLKKARCDNCHQRPRKYKYTLSKPKPQPKNEQGKKDAQIASKKTQSIRCFSCHGLGHKAVDCPSKQNRASVDEEQPTQEPPCRWHPGGRRGTIYLCCNAHVSTPGCRTANAHNLPASLDPALATRFQVHPTPSPTPPPQPKALAAVAIDCEMGTSLDGDPELIRVTLIDYFTGTALLDALVWPDVAMAHFNTRYSGVTRPQMHAARRDRTCLLGVAAARREVWRYVGADTVVIGHDVKNDLAALKWAHRVVVDSMLLEAAARKVAGKREDDEDGGHAVSSARTATEPDRASQPNTPEKATGDQNKEEKPRAPGLNLKAVAKLRLGRDIQKRTHDSLEDALASRDIVHHHVVLNSG